MNKPGFIYDLYQARSNDPKSPMFYTKQGIMLRIVVGFAFIISSMYNKVLGRIRMRWNRLKEALLWLWPVLGRFIEPILTRSANGERPGKNEDFEKA